MELGFHHRRVVITGASGAIGRAVARRLAEEGARLVLHARSRPEHVDALRAELPGPAERYMVLPADLSVESEVIALFAEIEARWGGADILIANAGHWPSVPMGVIDLPAGRLVDTLAANLLATVLCCREFLRLVRRTGGPVDPAIVMTGSTAGTFGEAGHADYAAAKGAIQTGLLKSLKNEIVTLAPAGRVNVVAPGWTVNDRNADRLGDPAVLGRVLATRAQPRVGQPEDIAAAVAFLASSVAAGHLTGEVITVSGGMEGRLLRAP